MAETDRWVRLKPHYSEHQPQASLGIIGLSTDKVGISDFEDFLSPLKGRVAVYSTRIPMAPVTMPETLATMGRHLTDCARLIVSASHLDLVAFSCTSGTVAIGLDRVHAAIEEARPGIKIATPMQAGVKGLSLMQARRIVLLTPYRVKTAELVAGFFEQSGFTLQSCGTFDLDGDTDMNRVSPESIIGAAVDLCARAPPHDAVFISCTGLRTYGVIAPIEAALGRPVLSSNQALAWDAIRQLGVGDRLAGIGSLFDAC